MRPKRTSKHIGLLLSILALALSAVACGDEEEDAPAGPCSAHPLELSGAVGEVDGQVVESSMSGFLDTILFSIALGEVEFTPAGGEPEMRPRILTFGTNVGSPEGRELLLSIDERVNGSGQPDFEIVARDIDSFCDVSAGQLCARFGLDDDRNGKLITDNVVHEGVSGTFSVKNLNSTTIAAEWNVDFGPNLANPFDESSGSLEGCFRATYGNPVDNRYTLK